MEVGVDGVGSDEEGFLGAEKPQRGFAGSSDGEGTPRIFKDPPWSYPNKST